MQSTVYRALRKQKHTNFHLERVRSSLMLTKLATFISAAVIFLCFFVTVLEYFTRELYRSVQRRVNNIKSIVNVQPANTASVADTCEKKLTHTTRSVTSKSVSTAGVAISNKPRNSFDIVNNEEPTAMNKMTSLEISRANSLLHRQPKNPLQKMKNGRPCSFPTTRTELYSIYRNQGERQTEEQRILDEIFSCLLKGIVDGCYDENGLNALHLSSKEGHLNIVTELLKRGADVDAATKKGNTALHIASLAGQEDIVRVLVEFNANVNVQSQNGFTPLYMAAQENHVKVVKFLLANGANQNLATEDGFLPLDVATQQGHDIVVETLLQHSRPQYPNKSEDGFTPLAVALQQGHDKVVAVLLENDRAGKTRLPALHIAARKDDTKAASLLLQNGHNPDVPSKSQFTPLHIAAHYGHVNVATLLLQKGASVDYNARNHIKPLHVAAKWGRVNMVNTLLDRGACIDAKTRDGLTPLHCSARSGHEQCVDQLLERGAPISAKTKNGLAPLHMAAQGDHVDSARLLLYHHAPVDDVTVDYLTPLHVAAHCGHHKVAKLLLDRKANPSARALNGFTPLHIACKKNRVKVIELLLKYGASVQAITESGLTPLHVAAFMGNINIVMYLIKNGGGVDETNVRGETPLHLAARANQIEVIRVLLSNGAKVDARAHENQTPLHIAARLGNAEIVKLLLDNGASPDAQTRDLYTALHIAAREGKEDVARVLLDNGATLSMTTKKDFTPLHVAAKYGRYDVAQLLLSRYASPDATAQNGLTPLHIAAHYDNVKVAMLLLDQGASPHKTAKNGFTPLHIAAKKNQMDVATTLLEYGADSNAMTKQGISPIHLAAQEGHTEMLALLLERGAKPNIMSKNGLTPLHLAAQEDQVEAVAMLLDNGSQIDPQTKAGYTPLHVACHYGNLKTATYLLEHGSAVQAKTKHGLTPLHQGAQQGHVAIINILLQHKAEPNETANNGYTALGIAKRFGYISVVNTLSIVTTETSTVISPTEEKLKVQVPETMQVTFMSDTEDEESTGDDVSMTGDQSLLTPQEIRTMGDDSVVNDHRRSWEEDWMRGEPIMNYYTGHESLSGHYGNDKGRPAYSPTGYSTMDSRNSTLNRDFNAPLGRPDDSLIEGEMITVTTQSTVESAPPLLSSTPNRLSTGPVITLNGKTYNIGDPYVDDNGRLVPGKAFGPNGRPVSVTLDNAPINQMPFFAGFLISFIVDARGGTMRSCRLPGLRVVVPPQRASGPTRVTCRLIKRTKLTTQPPLMENESLASRVLEVGPANTQFLGGLGNKSVTYPPLNDGEALCSRIIEMGPPSEKFLRPVLIEVPHFASLRGNEREIVILRSETGETWKEHSLDASDEEIQKSMEGYDVEDNDQSKGQTDRRMCRILTKDFPQYFAIISRVRQETNTIGPSGGMLNSTVVPQVQAVFPEGTLTKKIKVGLQAQPVGNDVVKKVLGNRVMVSPIVTIEPRRRKFHKPITVTIPVPTAYNQGVINGYGGDFPTLRLLCSITGGTAPAQWEDITGTTPLTFVNDCVSFTTTVSARFWLMDCKEIDQASNFARELYQELKAVPFMAKFVVYAKTHDPIEGRVRVFCVTDDKSDKSLEQQENFKEVARSKFVEVLESRPVYIEMAGNLVPVQKSGDQLNLAFTAFHENRLPFFVRVRDQSAERCGRLSFMREPKVPRGLPPQKAACNLNVTMPSYVKVKKASESETESESSSEDEEYKMEKGEREQYTTQKEQKMFTKKELYSLTSIEEYQDGSKEQDGVPSNLNFASIKLRKKYTFLQDPSMSPKSAHQRAEIRLWDVANQVGDQWQDLGRELGLNERELKAIERENDDRPEQAFVMLHNWAEQEGKDATSEKLEEALRSIGRGDIIDRCLGNYVSLDVSAQPDEDSDMMRDIQMALDQSDRLGNDLGAFSPQGQADITLEFSGGQQTPDILQSTLEEQARQEVTDRLIKELKEEAIEASSSEDVQESAAAAEFYEEIKEEILEKHEEERRELHFEPSFGTLEETKEEDSPSPTGPQDVRDSARPTDLGEPGKPTEHQEKTRVETTRSETVTTVRTVEQKIITGETTKMEIKEDFPEEPPKESEEYKEKVLDHEMPPKSKELEPVDTFESKVKDVERLQESGAVEQIQAQVVQDIPVKEVEKERVENREIVLEYDVKSEVKESEKPTDTGQPCEELAMEDQEVDAIVMVHDSRVSQDVNIQGEYQAVPLERLVQSPEPVASPDAEQKEIYEHEQQKEVTVVRETTKVEEKTVNVVEIKEERHVTQEPEVSESVAEQPESPMQTKNLQSFDKPSEILAAEKEDDETVKEESKAMAAKELSDEPVIEMDKVEEVKEEVEEAPQSPKRENETVTHYQETVTTVVTTTEIRGLEQQEVDGGIFSRPTALEDKEESGEIPGEQVREYVSNVVDSAIIQEQSRTELVDEEDKKPSVDSDNLKEVSQFEDSQESTTVLEKEPDEVVKEAIEVKEKEQVFDDESQEQQAPILTSEPIQDTPEDVPKEEEQSIRTTFIEQKTEEVVVKETVQVIEKEQVVFEDEPQEDQAPTLASEPIQAPEDVPKEEEQSIRTTFIEQKTEEVVVKETVQVIEKEQVVFEDEPHADQTPTVTSEHIHDTPEGAPEEEQPIGTTFVEQKTEEVVVKETVQVIEKEQVVFEDEPPKEQAPTLASEPIQAPKDVPKGDDQPHIEQKTEEVVVKETVQVIEKEQVVLEDEPPKEQAPTLASEPIQAPKDVPKGDDQPHIEQKTEEVVVKETVQVIEKEQVVLEDEPPKEQAPTLASEPIQAPKDVPKGDDQPHIEQKTEEVVVKETVQVIEKEQVVFEDEPQKEQAPTLASEPIQASPEDVPKGDDQPHIEQKTEEVVIKETVQVIEKEQVVFEDEPQADQTPTVTSEHIRDTSDDIPKEEEQSIRTTFIEQKTEEFVVKETVQVIEKEQVVFEDEPPKEQAPTLASEPIQAPPEDVPKGDDQPHIEQKTEEVVIKETVQVIEKEQVVFEDEPEEEQSPTPTSEPSQYTPEDVPEENDQPITEQKTEDVVVKETVQVIEKEQVIFEDEPQEDQTPTVISEHILDTSEDIPKEEEQSIRTTFIEQKTEEVVVKETVQVIEKEQVVFEDEPQADRTPTDTSEHIHDTPEDVPEEEEQPIGTTFIEQKTEEVVVKETVQVIEKEQVVFEDEPQADRTPTDTSEHIHDTPEDVPEEEEQPIGTTFIEQKTEEVVVKETIQVIEKEQVIFEDEPEADQTPTVTSEHIHDVPEDVPEEEEQPIGTTFTEQKTEEVAVKETVQVIEKEQVVFEDEPQKEQAPTLASEPIQAPKDVPKGDDQPYIEQKTEEVVIKETVQVIEKEQVVFENEPQEEQPATFTSEPFQNTPEDVPKEEEQSIRTTFIEQKTEEVVVKETVQVIEKEQVVFEDEPHADQTPTVTSEHIHDTPEGVPEEEQPIGTTFIEQKTEEVVVKETTQVIEKEEVTFEDETKEEQAQTVTSEHIQDATYNVQEDIPKVPVEEPTVEDSESGQDMTLHKQDEFTTQNLEFLGAPEYDEEDISTSMEVMPSERENVDGDDDFLEDIQEEPEGDEMERTDIAPSETTYIYEERTQQVLISNEQIEPSAVTTESHEEIISEERIGEKSSTTEFSHTVLQEEIHLLPEDATVHLEHDTKPQNEEKRDIIHENIEESGVTAVHSEINFHTKPIMDQTKVDEEKLDKVPDDREIIVQEPLGDEPEVCVEARDPEHFTEATPQDHISEISITEERIGEKVVTSTFKETVLHEEIHNIVEESPAVTDESEPPKEEVRGTVCETVHQTTVTTTHTEIHKLSTLPVTEKYLEEMSGEEQHTPEEEQTQPTNAEREDLSPRDEGMTSEDIEELQEDQQGQIRENGSFSHETTTEETRSILTTREVRFVEDIKVDASEPEDETHLGEEPDMTERDISIDEDQSDDSDMIPEIKLDLQSDEIVQDDDVLAERRARDHGYLIEPDPPTEESEIILGEDEIFEEQLGVDDEDLDTKTDSISYMEEQVDETTLGKEDQQLTESVPVDYDIQPSDISHVEDKSERRPEYKKEEADITTSYKTIEESMIIQGEVYLESEPKEEQKPDGGEMAPVEQELDRVPEDGRSTPDILDITGEYATSYAHVEMSQQSYQVDEPMAPLDVTQEAGEEETPRYTEEMDVSTGDSKEGAALVAVEQQYLVDTPVSETSTHEQWVETQVGDATVRTRETHREETYTDETEDGQTLYTRHVVTETRVITSGGPLLEGMMHPAEYPEELIIQPQPPSPDSLLTPEIQELPDTPESSTHEGSTEPTDNQGFCFETMDVTQSTSESSQFVVDDDVLDHQVQQQQEEQQEAPLLDGPTESDYYDPSLIGVPQQQEFDYQLAEPEPEIIDSPQDVELPEGEDISSQQYSDFTLQQEVSASLSHQDQSLGDVPHSETVVQESHVEFSVHSEEQSVPDNETFDVAEEDRADSIVSPRPPEPVSEVEAQLPPIDVSVLESSPAPEPETENIDEGAVGDEVDSPTKPYKGQIPIPTSPKSEGSEEPPRSPQGSVDDQSDHVVTHEEYETKQEDGGVVKKSVHVTRTTFRREVSFPGAAVQSGQAILQTRSVSEFHAGPDQTHLRSREEMEESTPQLTEPLVDEQLDAPMVLGEKEEKPAFTPEELEDFAQALNDFAINDLPEDDQESPATPSDQAIVQEDMSATESAPPVMETNLKTLDEMTPEEEKEMEDLLNMDFTKAYQQPTEEGQAPRSSEPEEVSPSTPASPTTPHVDLMPDDTDLLAAANQLQKEMEEEEPEVGGASMAEAGDEEREPKTPEITDFLEGQFSFLPDEPLGVVETEPNIEFPPEMEMPVDGDEDVEEEIEEYEETLDDGTIRKVIKRRIKKRTVQMIPVEIDPSEYPEGAFGDDDDVRRITVHKKVTRKTFMRDGEEVDQQEEVETNIEEDGVVKENSELREDLQQIVDGLLKDQSIEGESTTTVVVSEETHEGEESEI
ncbi:ankyrin-2-like isoform X28 [Lytechinus variegatus]|uniref:ankyrin-2-like isoform X28 n=1 Tax=Lytechinus variegatus TaxID=7654 RepID=UPI001BB21E3E|nr:ankyrin-2-like isoform X28 [Lytechinus variegatus]